MNLFDGLAAVKCIIFQLKTKKKSQMQLIYCLQLNNKFFFFIKITKFFFTITKLKKKRKINRFDIKTKSNI
jgi:hypothetical protein